MSNELKLLPCVCGGKGEWDNSDTSNNKWIACNHCTLSAATAEDWNRRAAPAAPVAGEVQEALARVENSGFSEREAMEHQEVADLLLLAAEVRRQQAELIRRGELMADAADKIDRLSAPAGEQPVAWRCFHCGKVCASEAEASEHFGDKEVFEQPTPACQLNVAVVRRLEGIAAKLAEVLDDTEERDDEAVMPLDSWNELVDAMESLGNASPPAGAPTPDLGSSGTAASSGAGSQCPATVAERKDAAEFARELLTVLAPYEGGKVVVIDGQTVCFAGNLRKILRALDNLERRSRRFSATRLDERPGRTGMCS